MTRKRSKPGSGDDNNDSSSPNPPPASLQDKMKGTWADIKYNTVLANFKLKKRTNISILEYKAFRIKSKFGVDYLNLVGDSAPVYDLQDCLGQKLQEFFVLHEQIKDNFEEIKQKELQINRKIKAAHGIVEDDSETSIEDDSDITEKEVQPTTIEKKVQPRKNSKSEAAHAIKDDNDTNEKTIRWKTPSKSALGTKLSSDKKADTTNYDSDSGNTAEMTLSDHSRPLRTALKGPGERKYGVGGERRRKKGTRSPRNSNGSSSSHGSRGSFGSDHSRGNTKVVTTTTGRQKRKPKRAGQRNSNVSSDHSRDNAKVVTTRTRPKGKPKNAQRNSFDSDSGSIKVVTTRTRPKVKKEPSQ